MASLTRAIRRAAHRAHRDERAQVLIFFAMFIVTVGLAMGVVAVDASFWHSERRRVQGAVDAAALAAAQDIPSADPTQIAQTAEKYAGLDGYQNNVDNVVVHTYWPPSAASAHAGDREYVEVTIDSPSAGFFVGAFAGVLAPHHGARAVAKFTEHELPCAVCVLNPSAANALQLQGGNASLTISGGNIIIDSTSSSALSAGNGDVSATSIGVVGGWTKGPRGTFNPTPTHVAAVADPLASAPVPSVAGPNQGTKTGGTIGPGLYTAFDVSAGTLALNPGVYVLTGAGITISGGGAVTGTGVMIYFACSSYPAPCSGGGAGVSISGNGTLSLSAPASGPYKGLTIFYDRNNSATLDIAGNGAVLAGTIYAKSAELETSGNAGIHNTNSAIIVDRMDIGGNGGATIDFTPDANYRPPPGATLIE